MTDFLGTSDDDVIKMEVGIGADLLQLEADLKKAEEKIANVGKDSDKEPIKIAITPDISEKSVKAFMAKIQKAVASQTVKVKVDATAVSKAPKAGETGKGPSDIPVITPRLDISDADQKLSIFEDRINQLREIADAKDITVKADTDAMGDVTRGVISYTNALGEAQTETYKLVDILDETGEVAERELQFVSESLSSSTTKATRFQEALNSAKNALDSFALKNADIADQVGIEELRAKFAELRDDTNAEVTAIQQFRNAMGEAKVKVDEIRMAQRAQADAQRQSAREEVESMRQRRAVEQAALQEQIGYEQAINHLRTVSMSSYRQDQRKITEILKEQVDIINRRAAAEKKSARANKQVATAVHLQKATLETTAYTAKLAIYAKDVAKQVEKARNNMSGMQGYARSTANIFKGIVLSQAFYKGLNAVKGVVSDAWELSVALNTAEATFSGMLEGGQETAQALLEVLKQEAINTPFDIQNLVDAARLLTAYGIQAENLMYVMRAVEQATAASGDASKMDRISLALGQIYTKGRLVGEEVRQLTEAGIAVSEILTEELGLTRADLKKDWAHLNIDANTAINAIVRGIDKRYGQALDNMAKTTRQKINNMRESFALITSSLTDPIRRAIDSIIDTITPRIERLYQAIQAVGLGNALKSLIPPKLFNAVVTAINGIVRAIQTIGIVLKQLKPVISAFMNAFVSYGRVLYDIFISILASLGLFGQYIGESSSRAATLEYVLKRIFLAILAIKTGMLLVAAAGKIWTVLSYIMRGVLLVAEGVGTAMRVLSATMAASGIAAATGFMPLIGILLVIIGLAATLAGSFNAVKDAVTRVGAALKNLGGGTSIGNLFQDMSGSLQEQIDAYNAKVTKQNAEFGNALIENSDEQTDQVDSAAGATKKAMQGLMSFDEVYKLMEPSAGGAGAIPEITVDLDMMPTPDMDGFFDDVGGLDEDLFADLSLTELQDALSGLWTEISPLLDTILVYGAKMLMYFQQMKLYSKLMTDENKEQWLLEKSQTSEDEEQLLQEQKQTTEDEEQLLQEQKQTTEDEEQLLQEQKQTTEDEEQLLQEQKQTTEDEEQLLQEQKQTTEDEEQLLQEQKQTTEDEEQLLQEQKQTIEDEEQLLQEQKQSQQDSEQLIYEKQQTEEDREQWTISRTGGAGGGAGTKGTAAALALINVAQIAASTKLLIDNFKEIADGSADLSTWMSLFVNGLMMAVDVLQLMSAFKILFGGLGAGTAAAGTGGTAAGIASGIGSGAAAGAAAGGTAAVAGTAAIFLAIPAIVGGILYYVDATTESISKYSGEIDKIQKARANDSNITNDLLAKEHAYVDKLASNYHKLAGKEQLTAAESEKLKGITQQLVKIYPDLNNYVDKESGLLTLSTKSMDSYIKSAGERAGLDALTKQRLSLLEEEEVLVKLLAKAEAEEADAREVAAQSNNRWAWFVYDGKKQATDKIRALLEQNGIDLKTNEEAYAENAEHVTEFQEEIIESVADRVKSEAELLTKQQDAYHDYYQTFENKTAEHHTRLNALSATGYAEADLSMQDWLTGMTKRQKQEYEIQENLAKLKGRDIPVAMLEELEAAGPQYSKLIEELANANDDDLNEVVGVWEENGRLAREKALDEIGEMPDDARDYLSRYRNATDEELEKLVNSYAEQHKLSREEAIKELTGLPVESEKIIQKSTGYVIGTGSSDMRGAYRAMGKEGVKGLSETEKDAIRASGQMADSTVSEADKRVKLMSKTGGDTGGAYSTGLSSFVTNSGRAGDALALSAINSAKSSAIIAAWAKAGTDSYKSYGAGIAMGHRLIGEAGKALAGKAMVGASSVSLHATGSNLGQTLATGISSKGYAVSNAFKSLLNNMLPTMELFTGRVATALNTMLSNFSRTMTSLSISTSGSVSYTRMSSYNISRLAEGGQIYRAARGIQLLKKPTRLASNVLGGEDGAEIVFPLENTKFIKSFADDIAKAVSRANVQQATQSINVQMEQARAGATQMAFSAPSAEEISDAIRSWFTPQMQSLHDVLEQDRTVDLKVPNTTNALYRLLLTELKNANAGAGARGFLTA